MTDDQPGRSGRPGRDKNPHRVRFGRTSERDRRRVRSAGESGARPKPVEKRPVKPAPKPATEKPATQKPAVQRRPRRTPVADEPAPRRERVRKERRQRPPRRLTRRRVLLRRWVALLVVAGVAGLVVALFWTPLLGVGAVDVGGTVTLTGDQVRTAASVTNGTPMLRLDTNAIAERVRTLPRVASVDVSREWPNTVRIDITERTPIGVVNAPGGVRLVDATGFAYAVVAKAPAGLPVIQLTTVLPSDARTQAVVKVLATLPAQLRPQVTSITAQTPGGVQFVLANGRTVIWGDADNAARKGAVLAALLTQQGKVYDVSAPDLPTIS